MTLQEAKDKAAKNHEFTSWDSLCKMLKRSGVYEANIGVFCDEAAELYAASRAESAVREYRERQWIPVSERLPEAGKIVQLFNRKWKLGKRVLVGDTTLWHYDGDTLYTYDTPTHWQELPSPPNK